jgi:hypothetical protein
LSAGRNFTGFELEALWDDSVFGIKHWYDFSHIAVVTDNAWLRAMVSMFKPFFHGEVLLFRLSELPAAKHWIPDAKRTSTLWWCPIMKKMGKFRGR